MKKSILCLIVLLGFVGCDRSPAPSYSYVEPPVTVRVVLGAPRINELVGDRTIDVSTCGDFSHRLLDGRLVQNEITGTDEDPGTCALSVREGEQACRLASMYDRHINVRIRHRTGAALTADDCRDLAGIVEAHPMYGQASRLALSYATVEDDGNGCVYNATPID